MGRAKALDAAIADADRWFQDRWNEGAAACVGLIRMAEAIGWTCAMCKGVGTVAGQSFSTPRRTIQRPCHFCRGVGRVQKAADT